MKRAGEILQGVQQFSRTENPQTGSIHPLRELAWLSRRAVQEDHNLSGVGEQGALTEARLRLQRLREVAAIFTEVFILQEYKWEPHSETPRVIDLGGDIGGLTVLYWKSVAPGARVTLVEANPSTATVVRENLERKGLQDVEVINAAVSDEEGQATLYLHKPGAGYHPLDFVGERVDMDPNLYYRVTVPMIKLSTLIEDEKVDVLKIDIEGAEGDVIRELAVTNKLGQIDQILMEFHNDPANPTNSLAEVLQTLENAGFTIENVHRSGARRRLRAEYIDVHDIAPSETIIFMFTAKKP